MSVLIKGMEMPCACRDCRFAFYGTGGRWHCVAEASGRTIEDEYAEFNSNSLPDWCPLIEVSTPHGDLIDRWELTETAMIDPDEGKYVAVYRADEVDEAPVVIEAEGRE